MTIINFLQVLGEDLFNKVDAIFEEFKSKMQMKYCPVPKQCSPNNLTNGLLILSAVIIIYQIYEIKKCKKENAKLQEAIEQMETSKLPQKRSILKIW